MTTYERCFNCGFTALQGLLPFLPNLQFYDSVSVTDEYFIAFGWGTSCSHKQFSWYLDVNITQSLGKLLYLE